MMKEKTRHIQIEQESKIANKRCEGENLSRQKNINEQTPNFLPLLQQDHLRSCSNSVVRYLPVK